MIRHYRNAAGDYLGQSNEPIKDGIETAEMPSHGLDKYIGGVWVSPPEVAAAAAAEELAELDNGMVRVLEDLIDTLTAKGLITSADLPKSARDKIAARETVRGQM